LIVLWRQPNHTMGTLMRLSFYGASLIYAACHMYFCKRLIVFDHRQSISQIILNPADPFAKGLAPGLFALLGSEFIVVNLGET